MSAPGTARTCRTCSEPIPSADPVFVLLCLDPGEEEVVGRYHAYDNRCIKASAEHVLAHPGEAFKATIFVPNAAERN